MIVDKTTGEKYALADFDEPARELFIWSVLLNRLDMAMLFWDEGKVSFCPHLWSNCVCPYFWSMIYSCLASFMIYLCLSAFMIYLCLPSFVIFLSFEWNLTRLGGPAHRIVTKTVHKTLSGGGGGRGGGGQGGRGWWGSRGGRDQGVEVVGSMG